MKDSTKNVLKYGLTSFAIAAVLAVVSNVLISKFAKNKISTPLFIGVNVGLVLIASLIFMLCLRAKRIPEEGKDDVKECKQSEYEGDDDMTKDLEYLLNCIGNVHFNIDEINELFEKYRRKNKLALFINKEGLTNTSQFRKKLNNTPLMACAYSFVFKVRFYQFNDRVELLLRNGANANLKNNYGENALIVMARNHRLCDHSSNPTFYEAFESVCDHTANINDQDNKGITALMEFLKTNDHLKVLKNIEEQHYSTSKVLKSRQEILNIFLDRKDLDLKVCDNQGVPTLIHALMHKNPPEIIELLCQKDPEIINIADKNGKTPLEYAKENYNEKEFNEIDEFFKECSAKLVFIDSQKMPIAGIISPSTKAQG